MTFANADKGLLLILLLLYSVVDMIIILICYK